MYRINEKLERTIKEREKYRRRYSKLMKYSDGVLGITTVGGMATGTTTILSAASVIGAPVAVVSGLGLGLTAIGGIMSIITLRIFRRKHAKHKELYKLAKEKLEEIKEILSRALSDNKYRTRNIN